MRPAPKTRRSIPEIRHADRERRVATMMSATEAKRAFGRALELAIQGNRVVITKQDVPKALLISVDEFEELSRAGAIRLDALRQRFDAQFDRMQTPQARAGMKAAFDASPRELGKAAVAVARRRR